MCPLCKDKNSSRRLTSCPMFLNAGPDQKHEVLCNLGGCRLCTEWSYNSTECFMRNKKQCGATTVEGTCGEWYHCSLHTAGLSRGMINKNTTISHSRDRDQILKEAAGRGWDHHKQEATDS